ncbi:MAG: hypothetical protein P4L46_24745 [Fimbriimonas sp.]|nr:hypothetical protein [Fimbriimonas sp.]
MKRTKGPWLDGNFLDAQPEGPVRIEIILCDTNEGVCEAFAPA